LPPTRFYFLITSTRGWTAPEFRICSIPYASAGEWFVLVYATMYPMAHRFLLWTSAVEEMLVGSVVPDCAGCGRSGEPNNRRCRILWRTCGSSWSRAMEHRLQANYPGGGLGGRKSPLQFNLTGLSTGSYSIRVFAGRWRRRIFCKDSFTVPFRQAVALTCRRT